MDNGKKLFEKLRKKYENEIIEKEYEQDKLDELYSAESEGANISLVRKTEYNPILDCYGYEYKCTYGKYSFSFYVYKDKYTVDNNSLSAFPDNDLYDMLS